MLHNYRYNKQKNPLNIFLDNQYFLQEHVWLLFRKQNLTNIVFDEFKNYSTFSIPQPSWRSWLARQSHNLKVVSSSLTEGILSLPKPEFTEFNSVLYF